jgi:hypothetical protein
MRKPGFLYAKKGLCGEPFVGCLAMLSKSIDYFTPIYLKRICWGCVGVYGGSIVFGILFWYEFIGFAVSFVATVRLD